MPLEVMIPLNNARDGDAIECGWWDHNNNVLVTDDCSTSLKGGVMTCGCSHLTDFMGAQTKKFVDRFKEGHWQYFGVPTQVKPILQNTSFQFIICYNALWLIGMYFCWKKDRAFVKGQTQEQLFEAIDQQTDKRNEDIFDDKKKGQLNYAEFDA